jgi:hypothetical protein
MPWVQTPDWLIQEAPERPGEMQFARKWLFRQGRIMLVVPLTREQVEEMHRTRQNYVLAARLMDGKLVILQHITGWSPHDPEQPKNPNYVPRRNYYLWLHGKSGRVFANLDGDFKDLDSLTMRTVSVRKLNDWTETWYAHNDFRERLISIYCRAKNSRVKRNMTEPDLRLCAFTQPVFGDFHDLVQRVCQYLKAQEFGVFS